LQCRFDVGTMVAPGAMSSRDSCSVGRRILASCFRHSPQKVTETQDSIVVAGFYNQSGKNPGQFLERFALQDHRLRPDRLSLERFEIRILDGFADAHEARGAVECCAVEWFDAQIGKYGAGIQKTGQNRGGGSCERTCADST